MTGKECLKILYDNLGCDDCRNYKCKTNREILRECDEWYEVVEQDLDRLEKLENAIKFLKEELNIKVRADYDIDGEYCGYILEYMDEFQYIKRKDAEQLMEVLNKVWDSTSQLK